MNKAALKRLELELRAEIGLGSHGQFDPYLLAEQYGVDVYQLSEIACSAEALTHFQVTRPSTFSGALVPVGTGFVIIENDSHDAARRRATAAHEMAHVALGHPFETSLVNERGCRAANDEHEREATELGAEMLLPHDAARRLACRQVTDGEAAALFGVSLEISRWRMNAGARQYARNVEAKRRRTSRS